MAKWIKIDDLMGMAPERRNLCIALLSLADSEGRVEVTKPRLCELTGLTMKQVRWQIERLFNGSLSGSYNGSFGRNGKTIITINNIGNYVAQRKPGFKSNGSFNGRFSDTFNGSFNGSFPVTEQEPQPHVESTTILPVVESPKETLSQPLLNNPPIVPLQGTVPPSSPAPSPSKKSAKVSYAQGVQLTEEEYARLVRDFGKEDADGCITYLSLFKQEKTYTTKSDNLAIRRWVIDAYHKQQRERNRTQAYGKPQKASALDVTLQAMKAIAGEGLYNPINNGIDEQ